MSHKIILNYPEQTNKQKKIWEFYAVYFFIVGVIYVLGDKNKAFGIGYLVVGFAGMIAAILSKKLTGNEYFIEFSEDNLKYKRYKKKLLDIPWNSIEKIEEKPLTLLVRLKDSTSYSIELENVNYKEVHEVKDKLRDFAKRNNIGYE